MLRKFKRCLPGPFDQGFGGTQRLRGGGVRRGRRGRRVRTGRQSRLFASVQNGSVGARQAPLCLRFRWGRRRGGHRLLGLRRGCLRWLTCCCGALRWGIGAFGGLCREHCFDDSSAHPRIPQHKQCARRQIKGRMVRFNRFHNRRVSELVLHQPHNIFVGERRFFLRREALRPLSVWAEGRFLRL